MRFAMPFVFGAHLMACGAIASTTLELDIAEGAARPVDFSMDATRIYFAFERFQSVDALLSRQRNGQTNAMLGIYSRSDGAEMAGLDLSLLWDARPDFGPVMSKRTVPYGNGVVVALEGGRDMRDMYLAYVDRAGVVRQRRRVRDFNIRALGRIAEFALATSPERLALFDESLDLKHSWRPQGLVVSAQATGSDLVVLDGAPDPEVWAVSAVVRWLTLGDDGLSERKAVELPNAYSLVPLPRLLVWADRALVVALGADGWEECSVPAQDGEVACGSAVWADELAAWSDSLAWAQMDVVGSADGHAVVVPNGCTVWARRYDRMRSIAPQQFVLPSGRSDPGRIHEYAVKELGGETFMLSSGLLNVSWWETGDYRIVLRKLAQSESEPQRPRPRIEGCSAWRDAGFGTVHDVDGVRMLGADDVKACMARGADPNEVFNCGEWTRPLSQSAGFAGADVVQALISAGAEVDARDAAGETALHKAARYAKSDATLRALLDGGADPTLRDIAGKTAWDYAKDNDALGDSVVLDGLRAE